ncbi:MAG: 30S ribosomal protein S6 [Candidatus Hydrogenedentes bacterium]|nr:30S ribosomal protein S6 [Candidatus Hydrogenedentota bacterium]
MRTYESLYILRPDLQEEEVEALAKDVESQITGDGGTIVRSETWGKRRLAYEVQKCSEGYYILVRFMATPVFVARLENYFRLTDAVIRYLMLHFDERTLRLEARQKKRKEAELQSAAAVKPRGEEDEDEEVGARSGRGRRYRDEDAEDEDTEEE